MSTDRRKRLVWRVLTLLAVTNALACGISWSMSPWRLDRLYSNAFDHLLIVQSDSQWLSVQFNEYVPGYPWKVRHESMLLNHPLVRSRAVYVRFSAGRVVTIHWAWLTAASVAAAALSGWVLRRQTLRPVFALKTQALPETVDSAQ